jgi:hypothetical protein
MKEHGELMALLLHHRERFGTGEAFQIFILDSVRTLAFDLREFNIDVSVRTAMPNPPRRHSDWNALKITCE